jgi:UDP-2,3-diacylglucosamine hydrolase
VSKSSERAPTETPSPPASLRESTPAGLPALFISDLHLAAERPRTTLAFTRFVHGSAREAAALYILGDLFECWAGDDDGDAPFNREIVALLGKLAATGTAVFFVAGNRDLLIGESFARAAGLTLLPDPTLIEAGGHRILLSHGDALCTDDHAYQGFRRQVRDPLWQARFLAQPLATRKELIAQLRGQSEMAKQEKAMALMDVNADAVAASLRAHGYPTLIHGHTHRPTRHEHFVDGRACTRHVLADWHDHPSWLSFDGRDFTAYP